MIAITLALAFIGYRTAYNTDKNINEYVRVSSINRVSSDFSSYVQVARFRIMQFLFYLDPAELDLALKDVDALNSYGRQLLTMLENPTYIDNVKGVVAGTDEYKNLIASLRDNVMGVLSQYENVYLPAEQRMHKSFAEITDAVINSGNSEAIRRLTVAQEAVSLVSTYVGMYSEVFQEAKGRLAEAAIKELETTLNQLGEILEHPAAIRAFRELQSEMSTIKESFTKIRGLCKEVEANIAQAGQINQRYLGIANEITAGMTTLEDQTKNATLSETAGAQALMIIIAVVGIALGIGVAAFIVFGLIRVLNRLGEYAQQIAVGNFAYEPQIKEGGEIGRMISSMHKIPVVIFDMTTEAKAVAHSILSGDLRDRIKTDKFVGEFAELSRIFNTIGDAYLTIIDSIPSPIMACSKNRVICFFNKAAEEAVGSNGIGQECFKLLNAEACDHNCLGIACMDKNGTINGETRLHTPNGKMDIGVNAIPLKDIEGQTVGFLEVINDLSEIKSKQNAIIEIAARASEISDRVASAAEELAAQIEQISRGADVQRERMESTATAMGEMNSTVLEVASNASQASEQSETTRQNAQSGAGLVRQVVDSMSNVNKVSLGLQENMQQLGSLAENIGGILGVISDIADQTNLLALNAAIEAARAGEAGQGFAVVADEVRKLAEKTMDATKEVGESISAIQNSTHQNINEVTNAVKNIAEATDLAHKSGDALNQIVNLASETSHFVMSIATAAEQQSSSSEEITNNIEEINRVVAETAEGLLQSSDAVQELSRMAQELRAAIENLR